MMRVQHEPQRVSKAEFSVDQVDSAAPVSVVAEKGVRESSLGLKQTKLTQITHTGRHVVRHLKFGHPHEDDLTTMWRRWALR